MKWISTTIKRKWLDKILSGEKTIERKVASEYWNKRLNKILGGVTLMHRGKVENIGLNLLCGRAVYKFKVTHIYKKFNLEPVNIDGIWRKSWWEIHIGERIDA